MKYIRTKDGIYELDELDFMYPKNYKQADTIEELCDEIILIDSHDNSHYELHRCFGEFCLDGWLKQNKEEKDRYKFYGAIWTGKGLIYVAKMNEKGELELL